jgi:hypothetical protein
MTEPFASGPTPPYGTPAGSSQASAYGQPTGSSQAPPYGQPTGPPPPAGDVTQTLAELERKLRELERELAAVGRDEHGARLVDEAAQPAERQAGAGYQPGQPGTERTPGSEQAGSPASADRGVGDFAARSLAPVQPAATGALSIDLEQLLLFRDRLERVMRGLVEDYSGLLPARHSPPPLTEAAPASSHAPPPPLVAPSPLVAPEDEAIFEGHVELGVGPFYDIGSLSSFEQQLARLPHATEASVRRFEASHAVIDLRLSAPTVLIRELRLTLGVRFSVRDLSPGRVSLTFDDA